MKKIYCAGSVPSNKALNVGRVDKENRILLSGAIPKEEKIVPVSALIPSFESGYLDMAFTFEKIPPSSKNPGIFRESLDTLYMPDKGRKIVLEYTEKDLLDFLEGIFKSKHIRSVEPATVKKRSSGGVPIYLIEQMR